jgi:hypothetical protein
VKYHLKALGWVMLILLIVVVGLSLMANDCERRRGGVWTYDPIWKRFECAGAQR